MRVVVFVCSGNTCRSPMAAALAGEHLRRLGVTDVEVLSAGEYAAEGAPATPEAERVAADYGLDLKSHSARPLVAETVAGADLILTMTLGQRDRLRDRWRDSSGRIFTLKEYAAGIDADELRGRLLRLVAKIAAAERRQAAGEAPHDQACDLERCEKELAEGKAHVQGLDVNDPFGRGLEEYRRCVAELKEAVTGALARFLAGPARNSQTLPN